MHTELDVDHLKSWIGRAQTRTDTITPRLASSLAAILDDTEALAGGDPAPAGIHWCLAPDIAPMSGLGTDGHPARGGFLPPVPLARRMWAGGKLHYHDVFRVGDLVERRSTVSNVDVKAGRSGTLCFVTVTHEYHVGTRLILGEQHDIVFREIAPALAPQPPSRTTPGDMRREVEADPVLLTRYSAVTFNGHRIHYDRDYTREHELYPGLLVHGPLQATYMLRQAQEIFGGKLPSTFVFRGRTPLYDGQTISINASHGADGALSLWVAAENGVVTMDGTATAPE
ncbi:MaoC family dehydratase N-terminal domain-containing protein [Mesorhizobium sp. CAU 1741]|uniref:FAS1-like dehydratase domain-containing protein n=1 Tax=Mesorhizobium sp. CAU 1741 TaxID=3140366 RepID=UPI00325BA5A1